LRKTTGRNSDLLLAVGLVGVAIYAGCNVFPRVRFDRERIEIWATPQQIQVSGLYHYSNPSFLPALFSLGLPFPVDAEHPRPSTYSIATATEDGRIVAPIRSSGRGTEVRFRLPLLPHEEKWVRVDYVQGTSLPGGTYILVTTRKWWSPLRRGDYILHLGPGLELESTNYRADAVAAGRMKTYSFAKTDFYPGEDWTFAWRESAQANSAGGEK
jgi:hypothetical protein